MTRGSLSGHVESQIQGWLGGVRVCVWVGVVYVCVWCACMYECGVCVCVWGGGVVRERGKSE